MFSFHNIYCHYFLAKTHFLTLFNVHEVIAGWKAWSHCELLASFSCIVKAPCNIHIHIHIHIMQHRFTLFSAVPDGYSSLTAFFATWLISVVFSVVLFQDFFVSTRKCLAFESFVANIVKRQDIVNTLVISMVLWQLCFNFWRRRKTHKLSIKIMLTLISTFTML